MNKKIYDVAEGVTWVNGAPTPKDRKVELSETEAQYDLGLGRITVAHAAAAPAKPKAG